MENIFAKTNNRCTKINTEFKLSESAASGTFPPVNWYYVRLREIVKLLEVNIAYK